MYGVFDNTYEGTNGNAGSTQITINGVDISAQQVGVYVEAYRSNPGTPVSAVIKNSTITTNTTAGIGVEVTGSTAIATLSNDIVNTNATGIEFTNGGSGSVAGNNFGGTTDNGTDLLIAATAGTVSIGDANQFYATN